MKSIWIQSKGGVEKLQLRETEKPSVKPDEVLVQVKAFGLNFADVLARLGMYPDAPPFPFIPGYEISGIVEKVGEAVSTLKQGDKVLALTSFGGYAEYAVASELATRKIPENLSWTEAAALPVNALTAYVAIVQRGRLQEGEKVFIQAAAGGVGLCAVQMAKACKAIIFGTAGSDEKCKFLKNFGVDHPLNYQTQDYETEILQLTQNQGVDLILDSLGGHHFKKEMKLLKANGRLCAIGVASMVQDGQRSLLNMAKEYVQTPRFLPYDLMMQDQSFIGINLKRLSEQKPFVLAQCFQEILQWVQEGKLKPILAKTFKMDEIQDAHRYLQERKNIGKVIVEIN